MKRDEELVLRIPVKKARAPRVPKLPRPPSHLVGRIEIARSYSFQLNMERVAGPELRYENRQFFCSAKTECDLAEAEATASKLQSFCKTEVLKSVRSEVAGWRKVDEKFIWTSATANGQEATA